jgi:hypothetical protein
LIRPFNIVACSSIGCYTMMCICSKWATLDFIHGITDFRVFCQYNNNLKGTQFCQLFCNAELFNQIQHILNTYLSSYIVTSSGSHMYYIYISNHNVIFARFLIVYTPLPIHQYLFPLNTAGEPSLIYFGAVFKIYLAQYSSFTKNVKALLVVFCFFIDYFF